MSTPKAPHCRLCASRSWVSLIFFAVDDQRVFGVLHRAVKTAVHAVVLEHVSQVISRLGVVDADDLDIGVAVLQRSAQSQATDTAETVNTKFDGHVNASGGS